MRGWGSRRIARDGGRGGSLGNGGGGEGLSHNEAEGRDGNGERWRRWARGMESKPSTECRGIIVWRQQL